MNKKGYIGLIGLCMILLQACQSDKLPVLSRAQQLAQLDSVLRIQEAELKAAEAQRLQDRLSIEKKVMVDSLLHIQPQEPLPPPPMRYPTDTSRIKTDTL